MPIEASCAICGNEIDPRARARSRGEPGRTRCTSCAVEAVDGRLHVVSGLLRALDQLDAVGAVFDQADDRSDAVRQLQAALGYSEVQAHHVADMGFARRTRLSRRSLQDESEALVALRAELLAAEP